MNGPEYCKSLLREEREYNEEHEILASENEVIDQLLERELELTDAFDELHRKLSKHPHAVLMFLRAFVTTAAIWSPDEIRKTRAAKARIIAINDEIAEHAAALSALLDERSELYNTSGFSAGTHYDPCKVIEEAGTGNHYFRSWVSKDFKSLRARFDLKYWPSLSEFMDVLASDAREAELEAYDAIAERATNGFRPSRADFFKAVFEMIEENSKRNGGFIPTNVKISDGTFASLANCAMDLGPEALVDASYVKRLRQRERERSANLPMTWGASV